jgi:hypothetical protein
MSTFEEETNLLDADSIANLKMHYMACYWQIQKDFLDYFIHEINIRIYS